MMGEVVVVVLLHIIIALAVVGVVEVMMVAGTVVAVGTSFVPMTCALEWLKM